MGSVCGGNQGGGGSRSFLLRRQDNTIKAKLKWAPPIAFSSAWYLLVLKRDINKDRRLSTSLRRLRQLAVPTERRVLETCLITFAKLTPMTSQTWAKVSERTRTRSPCCLRDCYSGLRLPSEPTKQIHLLKSPHPSFSSHRYNVLLSLRGAAWFLCDSSERKISIKPEKRKRKPICVDKNRWIWLVCGHLDGWTSHDCFLMRFAGTMSQLRQLWLLTDLVDKTLIASHDHLREQSTPPLKGYDPIMLVGVVFPCTVH